MGMMASVWALLTSPQFTCCSRMYQVKGKPCATLTDDTSGIFVSLEAPRFVN